MEYLGAVLGAVSASAAFWLVDRYLLSVPAVYHWSIMLGCLVGFGAAGYWVGSRVPRSSGSPRATRIASGLRGRHINATVDGVKASGGTSTDIISDVNARGDVEIGAKNIETKP
jgi:hypothetical protein